MEQTLVLIKPDALKNSLTGYMLSQLSEFHTGLLFSAAKIVNVSKMLAEEHYAEHKGKAFFPSLIEYISGALHYPDANAWSWPLYIKEKVLSGKSGRLPGRPVLLSRKAGYDSGFGVVNSGSE